MSLHSAAKTGFLLSKVYKKGFVCVYVCVYKVGMILQE